MRGLRCSRVRRRKSEGGAMTTSEGGVSVWLQREYRVWGTMEKETYQYEDPTWHR